MTQDDGVPKESLWRQLRVFLRLSPHQSHRWIIAAVAGSVGLAVLDTAGVAAMAPLMQLFADPSMSTGLLGTLSSRTGIDDPTAMLPVLAASIAVLFVLKSAATIPFRWWLVGHTSRVSADAACSLLRSYVLAPYVIHRTRDLATTYRNVGDATMSAANVLLGMVGLLADLLVLASIVIVMFVVSPVSTLLAVGLFWLAVGGTQTVLRRRQRRIGEEAAAASRDGWRAIRAALDGFRESRLTGGGGRIVDDYGQARQRLAGTARSLAIVSELPRYLTEIAFVAMIVAIAGFLLSTGSREHAFTVLGVFAAASLRALPSLNRLSAAFALVRSNQAGLAIVVDAVEELREQGEFDETPHSTMPFHGDIQLDRIHFRFPDAEEDTLRDVTVTVREHEMTAFVGMTGAGKSTLLDVVLGLLDPTQGTITCGGRSIHEDLPRWMSTLGVVPQEVFVLNDTLAANVAYAVPTPDMDRAKVQATLETVGLWDLANSLPEGIDTLLGERGIRLSGGQRQRLGLARALYREPDVLVLDEATSALDNHTEREIIRALDQLRGDLTVIVVAHRLSTVRGADKVVFLENGSISSEGSFEEVRCASPQFARLVELGTLD